MLYSVRVGRGWGVKKILVLAAVVGVAFVFSSAALASGLTCAHGNDCNAANLGQPNSGSHGTLPFTGIDLAGIAGVGALLVIGGYTLQRASRRKS
jgi:hypothetical protein